MFVESFLGIVIYESVDLLKIKDAPVAQGIEHRIPNPGVGGPIPPGGTNNIKELGRYRPSSFFFLPGMAGKPSLFQPIPAYYVTIILSGSSRRMRCFTLPPKSQEL